MKFFLLFLLSSILSYTAFAESVQSLRLNSDDHLIATKRGGDSTNVSIKGHVRLSSGALGCTGSEFSLTGMTVNDTAGEVGTYNSTTGAYTIPSDGLYAFMGHASTTGGSDGTNQYAIIDVDGSNRLLFPFPNAAGTAHNTKAVSGTLKLNKGDNVFYQINCTGSIRGGETFLTIMRID